MSDKDNLSGGKHRSQRRRSSAPTKSKSPGPNAGPAARPATRSTHWGRPTAVAGVWPRRLAVSYIRGVLSDGRFLDDLVAKTSQDDEIAQMPHRDRAMARLIAATVLRRMGQIDVILETFLQKPLNKTRGNIWPILQAASAQLLFLDTPPHAAINIAVEQCRTDRAAHRFDRLTNAVLRKVATRGAALAADQDEIVLNTPPWMWARWVAAYGEVTARQIATANMHEAALDLSINTGDTAVAPSEAESKVETEGKTETEVEAEAETETEVETESENTTEPEINAESEAVTRAEAEAETATRIDTPAAALGETGTGTGTQTESGIETTTASGIETGTASVTESGAEQWARALGGTPLPTGSVRLKSEGRVEELAGFAEGAWWVQDAAAALPAKLLGDITGKTIADICAAPGGKTAQLAAAGAQVTAVDKSVPRLNRLRENLQRVRLADRVKIIEVDGTSFAPRQQFDALLLDAPCTATGTMRRHPDIAHLKQPGGIEKLAKLQQRLLDNCWRLVKPGGLIIYCSCSLEPEEGIAQIESLLSRTPALERLAITADEFNGAPEWITPDGDLRSFPFHLAQDENLLSGMDGFYAARLRVKM